MERITELPGKVHEGAFWDDKNIQCVDSGVGSTDMSTCQNARNVILQIYPFHRMISYNLV